MENNTHNKTTEQKISTPVAIIIAGVLIMVAILLTKSNTFSKTPTTPKTLSEQVGVSKESLNSCISNLTTKDLEKIRDDVVESVEKAMKGLAQNERGTPYSIVIGKNNIMTEIRGAQDYASVKKIIDDALIGKVTTAYKGEVVFSEPADYTLGNSNAEITIIEYSDYECPFCKNFHPTLKKIVAESNGQVRWIYRNFPLHEHSFEKLIAANCVGQLKGNDAFWEYSDLLFGLLKTNEPPSLTDQL